MARIGNGCPVCSRSLVNSRFDATFMLPEGDERLFFGIPASLCEVCQQLYLDPELIDLLEVPDGRCTFAIESDQVLLHEAYRALQGGTTSVEPLL
jgi:hypothetical protein